MVKRPHKELRAEVHEACWRELTRAFGEGPWRARLPGLRRFLTRPSPEEKRARDLFAKLRSAIVDVVVFAKVRHEGERRAAFDGTYEQDRGGPCAQHVDGLPRVLLPLLRSRRMALPDELLTLLVASPIDVPKFRRIAQRSKKQPPTWAESSERSRLVSLLDRKNLLQLPERTALPYGSRFLTSREYALVCLLLDAGLLDDPDVVRRFENEGRTAAYVIREEEKRMRITLKRQGREASQVRDMRHGDPVRRGPD